VKIAPRTEGWIGQPADCEARLTARDGTGAAVPGEGATLAPADVASITCAVYDLDSASWTTPVATPTVPLSAMSALVVDGDWDDAYGRNFVFTVAGATFSIPHHRYQIQFILTLTGSGNTLEWAHEHLATPVPR
jgi:hypothetical protein